MRPALAEGRPLFFPGETVADLSREAPGAAPESGSREARSAPYSNAFSYYVLAIFLLASIVSVVDRSVLNVVLQPIKQEFGVGDTELGLLSGLAFALFFATLGIPIAAWADRANRRNILALAIAVWSVMTALCGFATSFLFLILFRIGTAVGEAGGAPPTQSLISDYFTQDKRATALSIYAMGATLGGMAGNLIGGWGNDLFGWRETFVIAGVPGLLVAFLVFVTVREPPRGASDRAAPPPASAKAPPFMDVLRHLWQRRSFRHMSLAVAVQSFAIFGGAGFGPTYLNRTFDMPLREAGSWLAGFTIFAAAGTLLGGIVADRLSTARNDRRWYMWVPGWGALVIVPAQLLVFLAPSFGYIPPAWILMVILGSSFLGPSYAMTQALVTPQMRAVAAAILIFLTTVIGQGLGPTAVGALSDLLAPVSGVSSLRYAIAIVSLMNLWAVIHYFLAARTLREDLDAVAATRGGPRAN